MSRKILLLLLLVLVLFAAGIYLSNPFSTLSNADRAIPLDHPEEVTSVVLEERGGRLVLERLENGRWSVNGCYNAGSDEVNGLLGWLQRIDIQAPLSALPENEDSVGTGIPLHIEVFRKNRKIRDLTVFPGTYGDNRFLVKRTRRNRWFIAGSYGKESFSTVFPGTGASAWREKILFSLDPTAIRSVELRYTVDSAASFRLSYEEGAGFRLFNKHGRQAGIPGRERATRYFAYFMQVPLEEYLEPGINLFTDSLDELSQAFVLKLETVNTSEEYHFFPYVLSRDGGEVRTDPYRLLGYKKGTEEYFRIRYMDIDPVLKNLNYFLE